MPFLRAALIAGNHTEIRTPKKAQTPIRTAEDLFVKNTVKALIDFDDAITTREIIRLGL